MWNTYQQWVLQHELTLWRVDESLSRLLFWAPPSTRGRETLLGLLELHRTLVQCAMTSAQHQEDTGTGASVEIACDAEGVSPRSLRLGIAVIQSLWPVAQELVRVLAPPSVAGRIDRTVLYRQAVVRQYLERLRFLLRITLLVRYWKRIHAANQARNARAAVLPGLLLRGGGIDRQEFPGVRPVPYHVEQARIERMEYVGRRTGRRVTFLKDSDHNTPSRSASVRGLRVALCELLYVLRPLLQAEADVATCHNTTLSRRMRVWALCLGMDVLSLWSVSGECSGPNPSSNTVTVSEWKRRRMRLFLYVLRSPIWERYTEPVVQRVDGVVYRFPLVGGLLRNFIWDWIYYWRVFRAEEG